jgi:hypothetical protein
MPYGKEAFMKTMICCFAILLMILAGAPIQAQTWQLYDNFKGGFFDHGYIDPDKWAGFVYTNLVPPYLWVGENAMEIQFGRFHIRNHAYGGRLPSGFIEESLYVRNHEGIKGIKATLNVLAAEVSGCPGYPSTVPLPRALARVLGHFFKSAEGVDIYAGLFAVRSNDSTDAFNVLKVGYTVSKCMDAKCMGYVPLVPPVYVIIGAVHLWENFVLSLQWDEGNDQFIFQLNNDNPVYFSTAQFAPYDTPDHPIRKAIGAVNIFTPCQTEGQEALVDVYFDNVFVLR